jgi:hypothetical protein
MQDQQAKQLVIELRQQFPHAFKWTFLFYSQMKTKGLLDERKEVIPWLLALTIFIPLCLSSSMFLAQQFSQMSVFDRYAYPVLALDVFFMAVCSYILWQIKHSSHSLYQLVQHTPIKLTVLIVLHAINFLWLQSLFLLGVLFFFTLSFGFIRLYKENLFRDQTNSDQYFYLQEMRRICFWSYKRSLMLKLKLRLSSQSHAKTHIWQSELKQLAQLHTQLLKFEHQYCHKIKYIDIDRYLDEQL